MNCWRRFALPLIELFSFILHLVENLGSKPLYLETVSQGAKLVVLTITSAENHKNLTALNLLFEPYKITKHSLFDRAKKAGLQRCISKLLSKTNVDVERLAQQNCSSDFETKKEVLKGFEALIEHEVFKRHYIQTFENAKKHGLWKSVLKKGVSEEEANKFKTVLNLEKRLQSWSSHQFLALERAKEQKKFVLTIAGVKIER